MSNWEEYDGRRGAGQTNAEDFNRQDRRNDDFGNRRERGRDGGGRGGNGGRSYEFKETTELRSDCIGMIIGRGGSNIQRLQTDYNVRVDIDKESGTVTVSGNNDGDVQSALNSIKDQMERADNRGSGGGGGRGYGGGDGGGYRDRGNSSYKSRYNEQGENDSYGRGGGGGGNYR